MMSGSVGLGIIFGNIVNNAIKYTPEGGRVSIEYKIARPAQTVEIAVRDTGMGIPADDLPNIFNEFFRAKNAKSSQVMGTGIGLSTVHTLVERYHGRITLDSQEDQGTTITVYCRLPPTNCRLPMAAGRFNLTPPPLTLRRGGEDRQTSPLSIAWRGDLGVR